MDNISIGITERGDAALSNDWKPWVYEKHLPAILITKNPKKLIEENKDLFYGDTSGNVILHATITGLGGTPLEPNVLPYRVQLDYIAECIKDPLFAKDRIVIRQDPLIPYLAIGNETYRQDIIEIASFARKYNLRYRTSFFDYYPHVRDRFSKILKENAEWAPYINTLNQYQPALHMETTVRLSFIDFIKSVGLTDEQIEICGEPGMKCTGCVSQRDLDIFGISINDTLPTGLQRAACACLGIKHELLDNKHPCAHNCAYCYWKD